MQNSELLEMLKSLEIELHQPECRADRDKLNELLHDSFIEFGRSGKIFTKHSVMQALSEEDDSFKVLTRDFVLQHNVGGMALLTYRSAIMKNDGTAYGFANRSSHWVCEEGRWQMCFHQGTPTEDFDQEPTQE